jgi:hypothetical protein
MAWLGKIPSLSLSVPPLFAEVLRTGCGLMLEVDRRLGARVHTHQFDEAGQLGVVDLLVTR